jgi:signal peptidase II
VGLAGIPLLLAVALATAALDQASKQLVTASGLRLTTNERASLLGLGERQAVHVWLAAVACLAVLLALASDVPDAVAAGLGLVLGGATSNLADRLRRGGVVDFIVVWRWPAFNLADAALVCGTAAVAWSLL